MLDHDELTTEESNEQNRELIEGLQRVYDTQVEDAQSLARIRAKMLQNGAGSLPLTQPAPVIQLLPTSPQKRRKKEPPMHIAHPTWFEEKPWQRRLSLIAAVILVAVLVGSLVLLLAHRQQSNTAKPLLRPGWTQVAQFSGSSSKTFTPQHIILSTLWGSSIGCTGNGRIEVELVRTQPDKVSRVHTTTTDNTTSECQSTTPETMQEPFSIFLESSTQTLDTIKVTVTSGSLNWYIRIANADVTPAPVVAQFTAPNSGWLGGGGKGGSGSGLESLGFGNGKVVVSKTWAVVMLCIGNSTVHIQFQPTVKGSGVANPVCDGQPKVSIVHYPRALILQEVVVTADAGVPWSMYIFACTDEHACQKNT